MLKFVLIPALTAVLVLGGCIVAPNAPEERKRLEQFDAGKPLPPVDEDDTRGGGGGGSD